jgi:hypothetical protein
MAMNDSVGYVRPDVKKFRNEIKIIGETCGINFDDAVKMYGYYKAISSSASSASVDDLTTTIMLTIRDSTNSTNKSTPTDSTNSSTNRPTNRPIPDTSSATDVEEVLLQYVNNRHITIQQMRQILASSKSTDDAVDLTILQNTLSRLFRIHSFAQIEGHPPSTDDSRSVHSMGGGSSAGDILGRRDYNDTNRSVFVGGVVGGSVSVRNKAKSPVKSPPPLAKKKHVEDDKVTAIKILQKQLDESEANLSSLNTHVKKDVTLVSQLYGVKTVEAVTKSYKWGLECLEVILSVTRLNYLRLAWKRFVRYDKYVVNCKHSRMFFKVTTSRAVGRILVKALQRKIIRYFHDWKLKAYWERELEQHAGILEVQSIIRMWKAIMVTQVKREYRASVNIQRIYRGNDGRQIAVARKEYLDMKHAVAVIENSWINLSMIRNAKKLVYDKKLNASASVIQRLWRIRVARVRTRLLKELRIQDKNALMIQSLYRGYITRCIVYDANAVLLKSRAAIIIQNCVRSFLAWNYVEDVRERWAAATCIQCMCRCRKARMRIRNIIKGKKVCKIQARARGMLVREAIERKRRWFAAQFDSETRCIVKIQNAYRTKKARERLEMRKRIAKQREEESAMLMQKIQRGRMTRIDFKKKKMFRMQAEQEKAEQIGASVLIQGKFRQRKATHRVKGMKISREQADLSRRATKIQSIQRARKGRRESEMLKIKKKREEEERLLGKYWVMQRDYLLAQDQEHGGVVMKIQSGARKYLGRKMVKRMLKLKLADLEKAEMDHAAAMIQNKCRSRNAHKELKKRRNFRADAERQRLADEEKRRFEEEHEQNEAARRLQSIQRGRAGRRTTLMKKEVSEQNSAATKLQAKMRGREAKKEVDSLRVRRAEETRVAEELSREQKLSATRLQALFRGNVSREQNEKRIHELKAERAMKEEIVRAAAATKFQCGWRKNRARRVFRAKKKLWAEGERQRLEDEELERNLEMLHQEQEMLLYVIRLQNAYRVRRAKKAFSIVRIAQLKMGENAREVRKAKATLKLQSWARGLSGREWMHRNKDRLRQELEFRSWCVECMQVMATRRCTTCLDRYCDNCWPIIHRAGRKRQHAWDVIDIKAEEAIDGSSLGFGSSVASGEIGSEWVEYFDDSAGSSYWYNVNTAEASWVKPGGV